MINTCTSVFKNICYTLCLCLLISAVHAQVKEQGIIPQPYRIQKTGDIFRFSPNVALGVGDGISTDNLIFFNQYFRSLAGYDLKNDKNTGALQLRIDSVAVAQVEGYKLSVTAKQISIIGHDQAGMFYGLQSLIQLLHKASGKITVQGCTIEDHPRFAYRGCIWM